MTMPILATKLYMPRPRPLAVPRPHLLERLEQGLHRKLTMVSAPAGFGKTSLVSQWLSASGRPVAWLSLDGRDGDPARFLAYVVAALQTVSPGLGEAVLAGQGSSPPAPGEAELTALLNEIHGCALEFVLVLDDYHEVEETAVDRILDFILEHQPPHMHLVLISREDPALPLPRLRARAQLAELRAADLRFTPAEAAQFLHDVMGLNLGPEEVAALEKRTEGWIAGLQLAGISLQTEADNALFIQTFGGSNQFVLDYLLQEVLERQPTAVQEFLLATSILDNLCGPLCDAVLAAERGRGQRTLEYLDRANLFTVPLDSRRAWYRYHHLFADLLRKRLESRSAGTGATPVSAYHLRASIWYEAEGQAVEAFQHAAAAGELDRAERLVQGEGMPLHFRGAIRPVRKWLASLPESTMDSRPSLWVMFALALTLEGDGTAAQQAITAAENALHGGDPNDRTRDLSGTIAAIRAMLAVSYNDASTMIEQSRQALADLHPNNLPLRTTATWTLGYANQLLGNRASAAAAYHETIPLSATSGNRMITLAATISLGQVQWSQNDLAAAAATFRQVIGLLDDPRSPYLCEAYLGLGRIAYERNDLAAARTYGQQSAELAPRLGNVDTPATAGVLLAQVHLAEGDASGAAKLLQTAVQFAEQRGFAHILPKIAAAQVRVLLRQGHLDAAAARAAEHDLPRSQARVYLQQGNPGAALALLEPVLAEAQDREWRDEHLQALLLQALAYQELGEMEQALKALGQALAAAEQGGLVRLFVDEGAPAEELLAAAEALGRQTPYSARLRAAFNPPPEEGSEPRLLTSGQPLVEALSERELEVLALIAAGLTNREIGERLYVTESTIKGHNRNLFAKLQVQRRTEAVARARELGLL